MSAACGTVIAVVGPTASGKSDLAIEMAKRLDGEVVSADSMQVYRGMDIGTAKVPPERRVVRHYGIDLVDPGEPYSAALFQDYARASFDEIAAKGRTAVLCGGTGFYVRAALDDYDFAEGEQVGNEVREAYGALLRDAGAECVWGELLRLDPESAHRIHPNDSKRVIRALEMHAVGESYAERLDRLHAIGESVPAFYLGIDVDRDVLRDRIDARVDRMRELGLVAEVESLIEQGFREGVTARHAIGYKEVASALDGEVSLDDAFEQIKASTRRYAKRQRTWFRSDERINWIDGNAGDVSLLVEQACETMEKRAQGGRHGN